MLIQHFLMTLPDPRIEL